jgi:hypothetical protein
MATCDIMDMGERGLGRRQAVVVGWGLGERESGSGRAMGLRSSYPSTRVPRVPLTA